MRFGAWVSCVLLAGTAYADKSDKPVNLTTSVPTTIAVSSTVDNAAIKPEHIADGKLDTAWNSRTGDLTPHVMVRVPAQTIVTSIKLTAGFTKVDKKLGDLFLMNPRIERVRVTSGLKTKDFALDINNRGLQELTLDLPGGDIDIAVLASKPGTKKQWREISISELEVWGTSGVQAKRQKPQFRLRSLDALPTLTKAECTKIAGKIDGKVTSTEQVAVSADYTVCRIDAKHQDRESRVTLLAASHKTRTALGSRVEIDLENGTVPASEYSEESEVDEDVSLELVPLRTTEQALSVIETRKSDSNFHAVTKTKTTLYRVGADGLDELISWESILSDQMESNDATKCEGPTIKPAATMPKKLKVTCIDYKSDWHNDDISKRGLHETKSSKTYVWNGSSYDEQ
jgi:hypothetical protein